MAVISLRMRREPITLAERQARGWLDGLEQGFAPGTEVPLLTQRHNCRVAFKPCQACGSVSLSWRAYTDGKWTRIFDECTRCRHSVEVVGERVGRDTNAIHQG